MQDRYNALTSECEHEHRLATHYTSEAQRLEDEAKRRKQRLEKAKLVNPISYYLSFTLVLHIIISLQFLDETPTDASRIKQFMEELTQLSVITFN